MVKVEQAAEAAPALFGGDLDIVSKLESLIIYAGKLFDTLRHLADLITKSG